ncbi:hypothetical protein FPT15_20230 [Pseudomonas sp. RGB]|nr:hypothetical protein FPT15_20230 [Pseudomonas sp. RGB]
MRLAVRRKPKTVGAGSSWQAGLLRRAGPLWRAGLQWRAGLPRVGLRSGPKTGYAVCLKECGVCRRGRFAPPLRGLPERMRCL